MIVGFGLQECSGSIVSSIHDALQAKCRCQRQGEVLLNVGDVKKPLDDTALLISSVGMLLSFANYRPLENGTMAAL